ncbi:flavocytochrome c [Brenneria izbisi]|uniref:Flavocytochrome c n=1 Tax=Brenneria izbisi TaxID=2939450 RepID=A0AA41XVB0_9GAMM|nr:flavocytochrome c [Brenneria izbisi]MCV9877603.1 flavocytochrome c [Brenneria izbisi]MCV9880832.1 flavocytochrome c [Brenneria izbisi]
MTDINLELLKSFTLPNGVTLKNRVLMAPMTTCSGFFDGSVTKELIEYYEQRAGSIGTVIVECCFVDDKGLAFPGAIGIDKDDKIDGLAKIATAIKARGSKAVLQIYHGGRMVEPRFIGGATPVAPSALAAPRAGAATPVALTGDEVEEMVGKFGDAVYRAIQAGFDGVEIHGANTYLIQQFYSPNSNQRTDKWGGSRDKRAQFPLAILNITHEMVNKYADRSFIIGYRFSPEEIEEPGIRFDDTLYLLEKLAEKGLDYVHFSMGNILRPSLNDIDDPTPLIKKYVARRSAKLAEIPVIGVGEIVNKTDAETALENGYDLIAVGRGCIAYPDWTDRIADAQNIELYINSDKREALMIPEPLWRFSLVEAMIRDVNLTGKKFKAGVYQEKVQDESGELKVNVSFEPDRIKNIELADNAGIDESLLISFDVIRSRILDTNSPHVDAVTGATAQSEAIKKAVTKAMVKSCKEAILEEGGNPDEQQEVDVVVIGSGGAGLAAAIQASEAGASVIIIEKMPVIGGNTIKASAGMNAAETVFQKIKGIDDSRTLFYNETLKSGQHKNNPTLVKYFVEHAANAIDWLADHDIELSDITTTGGMSIDRTHRPASGAAVGGYLISGLVKNINKRNIDVMLDTTVTEILQEHGRVSGVRILDDENEEKIIATKAVIVATGGFSANSSMVVNYRPDLDGFVTTNHKGATGGGIRLLQQMGADTVDMGEIQTHPTVEQTTSYLISESIRGGGAILVSQRGERFFNELETRDKVSAAIVGLPEKFAYILFDEQVRKRNMAVEEYVSQGLSVSGQSIAELAEKLDIDLATLQATINRYNVFVNNKHDDDFGRTTGMRDPLDSAPFYAIRVAPGVHHTMGGVVINADTEVLNSGKQAIPGVYAAGEVVGGIHGANRIGGNAVADIIIFGIRSGMQAAVYAKSSDNVTQVDFEGADVPLKAVS